MDSVYVHTYIIISCHKLPRVLYTPDVCGALPPYTIAFIYQETNVFTDSYLRAQLEAYHNQAALEVAMSLKNGKRTLSNRQS